MAYNPKKKPSLRETMIANQKALEGWCRIAGKELPESVRLTDADLPREPKKRAAPMPSGIPTEHEEQKMFVKWFRMQFPKVRMFAVPNAAMRSVELASYLKAEGMSAGCPDIWVPEFRMAIELKRTKGSVTSDEQYSWINYLLGIGWRAYICKGFDEARAVAMNVAKEEGKL